MPIVATCVGWSVSLMDFVDELALKLVGSDPVTEAESSDSLDERHEHPLVRIGLRSCERGSLGYSIKFSKKSCQLLVRVVVTNQACHKWCYTNENHANLNENIRRVSISYFSWSKTD